MWASFAIRLLPRNFVLWLVVGMLGFAYWQTQQSFLPFGWNIPIVPFISCGPAAPGGPAEVTPPPTVQGAAYAAGVGVRSLRDFVPDVGTVRHALMGVAEFLGRAVGSFLDGQAGRADQNAPDPPVNVEQASCGAPCPGVRPEIVTAAAAARAAGFTGADLVTAVAVAGAESGYRPGAANATSSARGLWQIMQSAHRDKLVGKWSDPFDSATVAHRVWVAAGRSWSPWVGFTSGAYRSHLGEARQVATCATTVALPGQAAKVIAAAKTYLGVPYVFGGTSRAGVDCSGLVMLAFKAAGVTLPRVSADQMRFGTPVPLADLRPGDLVGFDDSGRNAGADHVVLYEGGGMVIEAAHPGTVVRERRLLPSEGGFGARVLT